MARNGNGNDHDADDDELSADEQAQRDTEVRTRRVAAERTGREQARWRVLGNRARRRRPGED